ncbi:MAG TPA: hypothetical protein VJ599_03840 [Nitrososphaeraceae archaeon]|nr:hypothetical protein [Nitrososphaeraceae archaeon]
MSLSLKTWLMIFGTFCVLLGSSISSIHAFLYENGTCTNEKVKDTSKHVINTNGTVDDFLKSIPTDNTILAEIVCKPNN